MSEPLKIGLASGMLLGIIIGMFSSPFVKKVQVPAPLQMERRLIPGAYESAGRIVQVVDTCYKPLNAILPPEWRSK